MSAMLDFFRELNESSVAAKGNKHSTSNDEDNDIVFEGSSETKKGSDDSHCYNSESLKKFKDETKSALIDYLLKRLVEGYNVQDASSEEEEEEEDGIENFASQEQSLSNLETQEAETPSAMMTMKKKIKPLVPCVTQINNICESDLNDLNLETKELNIRSSNLTHIWNLRKTKRVYSQVSKGIAPIHHPTNTILPLPHPGNFEFDGPFQWMYHRVLSFELTIVPEKTNAQLKEKEGHTDTIATYAQNAFMKHENQNNDDQVKRIRVFLYDRYADEFQTALKNVKKNSKDSDNCQIFLSMEHVPAKCIFPFEHVKSLSHQLLNCQDQLGKLSEYCVCIGDKSSLKFNSNMRLYFDDDQLRIQMISQGKVFTIQKNESMKITNVDVNSCTELPSSLSEKKQNMKRGLENNTSELNKERKKRNHSETYSYTKLMDLKELAVKNKSISKEVNVYGAVLGFSCISRTKTGNFFLKVSLIDESIPTISRDKIPSITLLIFSGDEKNLPNISQAGELIRAHRVNAQIFRESIQLIAHKSSSFLICRPNNKYQNSSPSWLYPWQQTFPSSKDAWDLLSREGWKVSTFSSDFECMHRLWQWAQNRLMIQPTITKSTRMTISALSQDDGNRNNFPHHEECQGDLTVMITAIFPAFQPWSHFSPRGYLRVWDGTGRPSSDPSPSPDYNCKTNKYDPPSEALLCINKIIHAVNKINNRESLTTPKKLSGRVVNVAIWESSAWEFIQKQIAVKNINVGKFVRLRNVKEGTLPNSSTRALMLHDKSFLTPLPDYTFEVLEVLKNHNDHIQRNEPYNNRCGILPINIPDKEPINREEFSPLKKRQRLTSSYSSSLAECISNYADVPFQVKATVVKSFPLLNLNKAEDFCLSPLCIRSQETGGYIYQFALCLKDAGNEVEAIVSDQVAQTFFGISAGDLASTSKQPSSMTKLQDTMKIAKRIFFNKESIFCRLRSVCLSEYKYFLIENMMLNDE